MGDGYRWNDWNADPIAAHGVSQEQAQYVIDHARPPHPKPIGDSKWRVRGQAATGRYLQVIYLFDPEDTVYVIHARDLNDQEKRLLRRRLR